jgi:hypothetical protein
MGLLFKRRTTLFAVHDASYVSTVEEARSFPEVHDISNALHTIDDYNRASTVHDVNIL